MSENLVLTEKFEPGLKHALFSNFKNYKEAIFELTDNAVSNRIDGKILKVDIAASDKFLEITNFGGYGMDIKELDDFLQWGKIKERRITDIGAYSQGGKSAMGYLGKTMRITVSPHNKKNEYYIEDDDLHDYKLKNYKVKENTIDKLDGYVRVRIDGLRRKIKNEELEKELAQVYRPLLENHEVEMFYNGAKVKPEKFPVEQKRDFSFDVKNGNKDFSKVKGWVGFLIPKSGLKGGIRCYKLGRLIKDQEFFGHPGPTYKQSLNMLFGEVYLDHVPATTNKTSFDNDSIEWQEAQENIKTILQPYVDELLGKEILEPSSEEKKNVEEARRIFLEILKLKNKEIPGGVDLHDLSLGQKSRETRVSPPEPPKQVPPVIRTNKPKTPPPHDATGKRKRLKEFFGWELRQMDERIRSVIEEKNEKEKLLVINNLFPGYKQAKGNILYLIETAALQLSLPDKDEQITPEEYLKEFDDFYFFCCENLDRVKESLKRKKLK
jgi:hypothetical protein